MRRRAPVLALTAALLTAGGALAFVAARGPASPTSMDERVRQVASTLRCPVCQDLSVADSPSLVARQIRAVIARRLRAGQSDQEIRDFFVARFGPSILLTPQREGIDLLAWIAPALLFAAGLALLGGALRRWSRPHPAGPGEHVVTQSDRAMLERELKREDPEWA